MSEETGAGDQTHHHHDDDNQQAVNQPDWKDALRAEIKQMRSEIQALKKGITKGDKKAKKEVQGRIDEMEAQITAKQATINSDVDPSQGKQQANDSLLPDQLYADTGKAKAQEKKDKRAGKAAAKAQALRDSRPQGPDYTAIEQEKLKAVLKAEKLQIFNIEPDGHCLFASVAHQMSLLTGEQWSYADIRRTAADYMLEHGDFYVNFIDEDEDEGGREHDGIDGYCERVRSSSLWGGHLELDALAKALKRPIHVIQAEGDRLQFGQETAVEDDRPILLCFQRYAYTLGEHYDSLVPL